MPAHVTGFQAAGEMVPGELNQAYVRLAIVGAITLYTGYRAMLHPEPDLLHVSWFVSPVLYLLWSVVLLAWAYWFCRPESQRISRILQRSVCMLSDYTALSYGMYLGDNVGAPLYPLYLWMTFGNGIRYGVRYLYAAAAISLVSFTCVLLTTPYWQGLREAAVGLVIALALLPTYVARLLNRLNSAFERVRDADGIKTRFIANMSHELRTPLNGVLAVCEMTAQRDMGKDLKNMFGMIWSSARTQLDLINRILDVSQLAMGELNLRAEPFRVIDVVRDTADIIGPQARTKDLRFYIYVDSLISPHLIGSPEHLRQVLVNLLGNAVKFTERGHVELRLSRVDVAEARQHIEFIVRDTGIGIAREAHARIFKPFAQADSSVTRRYSGTGLGAAISQQLVQLMGGKIVLESEPGEGSSFRFQLELPVHNTSLDDLQLDGLSVGALGFSEDEVVLQRLLARQAVHILPVPSLQAIADGSWQELMGVDALLVDATHPSVSLHEIAEQVRGCRALERLPLVAVNCGPDRSDLADFGYTTLVKDLIDTTVLFQALSIARTLSASFTRPTPFIRRAARPLKVLVADDNATNQAVVRMVLEHAGHAFTLVDNGERAIQALGEQCFDLAIVDMHMPVLSGIDVIKLHRMTCGDKAIPIVLLTADITNCAREQAAHAGASAFLTKPIGPARLLEIIHEVAGMDAEIPEDTATPQTVALRGVPDPPLLDVALLHELYGVTEDRSILRRLLDGFVNDGLASLSAIRQALAQRRYGDLYDLAHALNGSARNVGARALSQHLRAIERLDVSQIEADGQKVVERLSKEFDRTKLAFDEFVAHRAAAEHDNP